MRATLMFETGWCGFGIGRDCGGIVLCLGPLRVTACAGRIGDRIAGYQGAMADAVTVGWAKTSERTLEQKAREAGL